MPSSLPTSPASIAASRAARAASIALHAAARELEESAASGAPRQPLLGLRLGLVCEDEGADAPALFRSAAEALGARVTLLDPARALDGGPPIEDVARLLGRLYGAVACHGLTAADLRRLSSAAQVPVLDVQRVLAAVPDLGLERGDEDADGAGRRQWIAQAAVAAALR